MRFSTLTEKDIEHLIPKIGVRSAFRNKYRERYPEPSSSVLSNIVSAKISPIIVHHVAGSSSQPASTPVHLKRKDNLDALDLNKKLKKHHFHSECLVSPRLGIISFRVGEKKTLQLIYQDLETVLRSTMDGNLVLAHYNNYDKCLDSKSRKRLTNCIVEHFFKEKAAMGQDDFKSCTDKIVEIFPSEKDSYDLYDLPQKKAISNLGES
jgi:hypothetical protein